MVSMGCSTAAWRRCAGHDAGKEWCAPCPAGPLWRPQGTRSRGVGPAGAASRRGTRGGRPRSQGQGGRLARPAHARCIASPPGRPERAADPPTMLAALPQDLFGDGGAAVYAAAAAAGLNSADDSLPYSTSELNAPEYSTDDFRMFQFKVGSRRPAAERRMWPAGACPEHLGHFRPVAAPRPCCPPAVLSSRAARSFNCRWRVAASGMCTTGVRARLRTPLRTRGAATPASSSTSPSPAQTTSAASACGALAAGLRAPLLRARRGA